MHTKGEMAKMAGPSGSLTSQLFSWRRHRSWGTVQHPALRWAAELPLPVPHGCGQTRRN